MSGCAIESNKRLPFVFGKQQLTDDESSSSGLTNTQDLNTIRLRFEYVTFLEYTTTPPPPPKTRGAIHETVAKATTGDSAGLGDPAPSPQRRWCKTEKVSGLSPVLFVFHYAPLEWLLAKGVVSGPKPRSSEKRKAPETSKKTTAQPTTPQNRGRILHELLVYDSTSDSDSDSDVVVVDDGGLGRLKPSNAKPPNKRMRSTPSRSKPSSRASAANTTPSKPEPKAQPKPKANLNKHEVIDLASSDDDFEFV
ncbi:hypothetical protein BN14_04745 [Rhizoctonia solani AG-1 IB]|nr:hypothetical protein BN14_04745 [Rhizoctonia solani AG-1 IB]